jgi:hypothetical protein
MSSVSNWFYNHPKAILPEEAQYVSHKSDLFAIVSRDKAPLRRLFEKSARFRQWNLWRKAPRIEDENVFYTSDHRMDFFVGMIITFVGICMLVIPLWILAYTEAKARQLAVITGFLVCFLCLVTFTTVAKPFESLGSTAA